MFITKPPTELLKTELSVTFGSGSHLLTCLYGLNKQSDAINRGMRDIISSPACSNAFA